MINQTLIENLGIIIQTIENYLTIIIIPLITIILLRRVLKEKRETGQINWIRFIIFLIFIMFTWMITWEFLYLETFFNQLLQEEVVGLHSDTFSLYNFGLGMMVSLALVMIAYANQWESFYYTSIFFYIGMCILFLFTGFGVLLMPYIYLSAVIALIFLFYTGLNLKDNGSLGLAIIFFLAFLTILIEEEGLIDGLINMGYLGFGLYFALGFFTPFEEARRQESEVDA